MKNADILEPSDPSNLICSVLLPSVLTSLIILFVHRLTALLNNCTL